ncbi:hypothetical protein NL676_012111 [Syzygium grande]|nr:hypothetical protein NL676_012111 [Syzygium grande]
MERVPRGVQGGAAMDEARATGRGRANGERSGEGMEENPSLEDVGGHGSSEGRRNLWVGQVRHLVEQVVGFIGWEERLRVGVDLAERRQGVGSSSGLDPWICGFGFDYGFQAEENRFYKGNIVHFERRLESWTEPPSIDNVRCFQVLPAVPLFSPVFVIRVFKVSRTRSILLCRHRSPTLDVLFQTTTSFQPKILENKGYPSNHKTCFKIVNHGLNGRQKETRENEKER